MREPYVVLVGDVGHGKSTIVEKLTGTKGRSSKVPNPSTGDTQTSDIFVIPGTLMISDCPGSNPMKEKFAHNLWIAKALNFHPVSKILIVVKADVRIDDTIAKMENSVECFLDLPEDLLGVCLTHMDTVAWSKNEALAQIENRLGIELIVFTGMKTPAETLLKDILKECTGRAHDLTVDSDNFLKYFKINNTNFKILKSTKREVATFETLKQIFFKEKERFDQKDQVDFVFEFQAWMRDEIIEAQKRVSEENQFTFDGLAMANEAGHIANMTNQLRAVLQDIRVEGLRYQSDAGIFRRCPYCSEVWTMVEGSTGDTECGARVNGIDVREQIIDGKSQGTRDMAYGTMATFVFTWDRIKQTLTISKSKTKNAQYQTDGSGKSVRARGCGKTITWDKMAPVEVPREVSETEAVNTDDVNLVPAHDKSNWDSHFKKKMLESSEVVVTYLKEKPWNKLPQVAQKGTQTVESGLTHLKEKPSPTWVGSGQAVQAGQASYYLWAAIFVILISILFSFTSYFT